MARRPRRKPDEEEGGAGGDLAGGPPWPGDADSGSRRSPRRPAAAPAAAVAASRGARDDGPRLGGGTHSNHSDRLSVSDRGSGSGSRSDMGSRSRSGSDCGSDTRSSDGGSAASAFSGSASSGRGGQSPQSPRSPPYSGGAAAAADPTPAASARVAARRGGGGASHPDNDSGGGGSTASTLSSVLSLPPSKPDAPSEADVWDAAAAAARGENVAGGGAHRGYFADGRGEFGGVGGGCGGGNGGGCGGGVGGGRGGLSGGLPPPVRSAGGPPLRPARGSPPRVLLLVIRCLSLGTLAVAGSVFLVVGLGVRAQLEDLRTLVGGGSPWALLLRVGLVAAVLGGYLLGLAATGGLASIRRLGWGMLPRLAYELGWVGGVVGALGIALVDGLRAAKVAGTGADGRGGGSSALFVAACGLEDALHCRGGTVGDCVPGLADADLSACVPCPTAIDADAAVAVALNGSTVVRVLPGCTRAVTDWVHRWTVLPLGAGGVLVGLLGVVEVYVTSRW
ncbi:hypothetical protein MMPV_003539 [Pyropia vietnamensis]